LSSRDDCPLLPLAVFDGPFLLARDDPDNRQTHLAVWADWLMDNHPDVPGVAEIVASVRAAVVGDEAASRGAAAANLMPYLVPGHPSMWDPVSSFVEVAAANKYIEGSRRPVVVKFRDGLPASVLAPIRWFQVFHKPGGGRLRCLLDRVPWVTVLPRRPPYSDYATPVADPHTTGRNVADSLTRWWVPTQVMGDPDTFPGYVAAQRQPSAAGAAATQAALGEFIKHYVTKGRWRPPRRRRKRIPIEDADAPAPQTEGEVGS